MPYHVGEKGSYGCSGYPAIKDDGTVMGCHETAAAAQNQITAINMSEAEQTKKRKKLESGMPDLEPAKDGKSVLDPTYEEKEVVTSGGGVGIKDPQEWPVKKAEYPVTEGDFVIAMTSEGPVVGQVEHVMREGGTYGEPGNPYSVNSTPENPAVALRMLEEEGGVYYYTPYSIGALMSDVKRIERPNISTKDYEDGNDMERMLKAETFTPNSGMKAAARRALKWKEDGKATGAGTPVGWGRASDIVAGRAMSLSVVRRMFSFFSRHEVDKKGKDFYNTSNPSNGRIMWDAWGGDAGFAWSRAIVNRMKDKALFSDFGKDFTRAQSLPELFKAIGVGSMVSWNSSGGRATGKIRRIIRSGSYTVPGTDFTLNASEDDPVAVITLYRDGKPTDVTVGHKLKTVRSA